MRVVLKITLKQRLSGLRQTKVSELSRLSEIKSERENAAAFARCKKDAAFSRRKIKHEINGCWSGAAARLLNYWEREAWLTVRCTLYIDELFESSLKKAACQ
jgi:hypothetical protein